MSAGGRKDITVIGLGFLLEILAAPSAPSPLAEESGRAFGGAVRLAVATPCYLGSFSNLRWVNPTTIPKAWSLPRTIESGPSGSGVRCLDLRNAFARDRSRVANITE